MSIMPPDPDSNKTPPPEHVCDDGCPANWTLGRTESSDYNQGRHDGYLLAIRDAESAPRWDEDPVVHACGWLEGRCGKCGEPLPDGDNR